MGVLLYEWALFLRFAVLYRANCFFRAIPPFDRVRQKLKPSAKSLDVFAQCIPKFED